jgi:hypothetical protein
MLKTFSSSNSHPLRMVYNYSIKDGSEKAPTPRESRQGTYNGISRSFWKLCLKNPAKNITTEHVLQNSRPFYFLYMPLLTQLGQNLTYTRSDIDRHRVAYHQVILRVLLRDLKEFFLKKL